MNENIAELAGLMKNRAALYHFLENIYIKEIDTAALTELKSIQIPETCGIESLDNGYSELVKVAAAINENELDELAVDYARVFLGAGGVKNAAAFPYESVYTSPKRLIMQDARDQVVAVYRDAGVEVAADGEPEDHISFELAFMAALCERAQTACENKEPAVLSEVMNSQNDFLENHLLNWLTEFCDDIEKYSQTGFYKAIAMLTKGFMELEEQILSELSGLELSEA